eukprot:jgi/Ulvmu1/476/UM001_0484.1
MGVQVPHCIDCKSYHTKKLVVQESLQQETDTLAHLERQVRVLLAEAGTALAREQRDHVHAQLCQLMRMPSHTGKEHPYESAQTPPPTFLVKALRSSTFPAPAQNKASLMALSLCNACKSRPPGAIDKARKKLSLTKQINNELHSLVRRLSFQIHTPGGPQNIKRCIYEISTIGISTDVFVPPVWRQAVSPRFLRRLCKLYTASDLTVDHAIPTLHYRANVLRSPYQGELYVSDRFREYPDLAPKYRTGLEWEQHLCRLACKASGSSKSFVEAIHESPSRLHFPPQSALVPHRPTLAELTTDEKGSFPLYGPTAFVVVYDASSANFYEVCEAVWVHWMRLQQEQPGLDADSIFYWIDIFAMSPDERSRPLCMFGDKLLQVVRHATHGVLLHSDALAEPTWQSDPWAQWFAWQSKRWLKSFGFIRPLYCERLLLHEPEVIAQAAKGQATVLAVPAEAQAGLARAVILAQRQAAAEMDDQQGDAASAGCQVEYEGWKYLLTQAVKAISKIMDMVSPKKEDLLWVLQQLHTAQVRSNVATEALAQAAQDDCQQLLVAKAIREGLVGEARNLVNAGARIDTQVSRVVLSLALAQPGIPPEHMVATASGLVCASLLQGDPRCGSGMNVLHRLALQPALMLTRGQNTLRKLMELYLKTGPNINGRDFWGQTPLHLLLHHASVVYPVASAAPEVYVRLTGVLVLMLESGADVHERNGAGLPAAGAGDAGTAAALEAAVAVVAGEAALEGCVLDLVEEEAVAEAGVGLVEGGEGDAESSVVVVDDGAGVVGALVDGVCEVGGDGGADLDVAEDAAGVGVGSGESAGAEEGAVDEGPGGSVLGGEAAVEGGEEAPVDAAEPAEDAEGGGGGVDEPAVAEGADEGDADEAARTGGTEQDEAEE